MILSATKKKTFNADKREKAKELKIISENPKKSTEN